MSLLFNLPSGNKKCRLCLRKTEAYINLFDGSFPDIIMELTSLKISADDGFPKIACITCINDVQQANNTRKRILECHSKLQHMEKCDLEASLHEANGSYSEVALLTEYSDDLAEVDEMSQPVSSPGLGEILSSYEEFGDEDRLEDFQVKCELNSESIDLSYDYDHIEELNGSGDESTQEDEEDEIEIHYNNVQEDMEPKCKMTELKQTPELDKTMIEVIRGINGKTIKLKKGTVTNHHCEQCNSDFETKYAYYLHTLKHKKSKCKICGILIRTDNMAKHIDCHTSGPRICDLCGTTCKNIESLRGHIFYMHRKTADQYKCDQCDRCFRMKYKLELHKKKEHIGIRGHVCGTCKKGFFTLRDMNHHIKMTHLKLRPHVCPHCERGFSSKYALKTHVRQHTNETPYKCYICAEGFRQNVSLRTHLKSKHNIEEVKKFSCEFCDKSFSTQFALKVHYRLHSDDNYKCGHCEECFQQKVFLVNHLKSVHNVTDLTTENLIYVHEIEDEDNIDS